jgi:hypothetical protein
MWLGEREREREREPSAGNDEKTERKRELLRTVTRQRLDW